jgi:signal transduction histidine kinase
MFLANMSHELRTPLNAVIGFSDIIEHETLGPLGHPKYREYAADIRSSGEHLLGLINDVLDHTKAEQGYLELDEEAVEVASLIDFATHMLATRAQRASVAFRTVISPDVYALRGDERRLRQIILNLTANSVKFTPSGGQVTIDASLNAGGEFVLSVEDTGIGISTDDQQRILQPFVQVDTGHSNEGTGLGLPLAKRLAELHGGSLDLRSNLGVGTVINVRLPAARVIHRQVKSHPDCVQQGVVLVA